MSVVAVVQHCAGTDVETNLATLELLSKQAASSGAEFITWPEAFAYIGRHEGKKEILESLTDNGPILTRCRELAANLKCPLLLGGFHEAAPDRDKCFNTTLVLDESGEIATTYRKIHLFDVAIENGPQLMESKHTEAGDIAVTTETIFGKLGLTICYDVRFPALYQRLTELGAIAHAVPSAFTKETGQAHWHTLLRARAIETQSYIIAPAQHGRHSKNRSSFGHSVIIDPWGRVLAELPDGDGFALAEINEERVSEVRAQIPSLLNKRAFRSGTQ